MEIILTLYDIEYIENYNYYGNFILYYLNTKYEIHEYFYFNFEMNIINGYHYIKFNIYEFSYYNYRNSFKLSIDTLWK
jgi:hypothetical protein